MDAKEMAKDARGELRAVRSKLAVWVDAHPRIAALVMMVIGPLAAWKIVDLVRWIL